jgi:hypothetical protein
MVNIGKKSNNMAIDLAMYDKRKFGKLREFKDIKIKTFSPQPNDSDYTKGYITRYFIQRVNDVNSPVYEVSQFSYNRISDNPFYITQTLNWRITGNTEDIKNSNSISVKLASVNIPNLKLYLLNYLQFSK